jgi:hypothetical protein
MAGPLYWKGNLPPLNDRTQFLGYENACDFLAAVDAVLLPSDLEGGPIVLLEAWAMRVPFFMRLTGLAIAHAEAVQIIGTNASETVKQILDFMDPSNADTMEAFMDKGSRVLNQKYTTDVVHKLWVRVIEETLARKRMSDHIWRAPLIPIRMPEGNLEMFLYADDFQVDRLGHAAAIDCWSADRCEANINFQIPPSDELPFTPNFLLIEYRATSPEPRIISAGTMDISSPNQQHPYHHTIDIPLSMYGNNNVQLCFQLPSTAPPKIEVKFLLHKNVHLKVVDISAMDYPVMQQKSCVEVSKYATKPTEEEEQRKPEVKEKGKKNRKKPFDDITEVDDEDKIISRRKKT